MWDYDITRTKVNNESKVWIIWMCWKIKETECEILDALKSILVNKVDSNRNIKFQRSYKK